MHAHVGRVKSCMHKPPTCHMASTALPSCIAPRSDLGADLPICPLDGEASGGSTAAIGISPDFDSDFPPHPSPSPYGDASPPPSSPSPSPSLPPGPDNEPTIPLYLGDRHLYIKAASFGTPSQPVHVAIDTSSSAFWAPLPNVTPSGCKPNEALAPSWSPDSSSTYQAVGPVNTTSSPFCFKSDCSVQAITDWGMDVASVGGLSVKDYRVGGFTNACV